MKIEIGRPAKVFPRRCRIHDLHFTTQTHFMDRTMPRFNRITPRVPVADLRRTMAFYTTTLGFHVSVLWSRDNPTFCVLDRDEISIGFFIPDKHRPASRPGGSDLYIEVRNVQGLYEELKGKVRIEWGPEVYFYGRREFAILDPDGYLVIFSEETDDTPTCSEE